MKRILAILLLVVAAVSARPQAIPISGQVISTFGQPVPNASVWVCSVTSTGTPCQPTAAIYQDYALTIPAPNPTTTDMYGNYTVFGPALGAPNLYEVQVVPQSGITYTYVVPGPACPLSGCTFAGPITATLFNATTSPYYEINGVQISSAALSDASNLAYLNAANIFTGSPQTAPVFNATTEFDVGGVQISAANLSNGTTGTGALVLATGPTLISPTLGNASASSLTTSGNVNVGGTLGVTGGASALFFNATGGFQIGALAPLNHVLVGNGTYYVDSTTIPSAAFPALFYQTALSGTTSSTALIQRPYFAPGTGIVIADVSTGTARTTIAANTTTSNPILDPFLVGAAGAGTSGNCMQWDSVGGAGDSGSGCGTVGTGTLASTGYWITPFGLIFEWGTTGTLAANTPVVVTLPFTFPHSCYGAWVGDSGPRVTAGNVSPTGASCTSTSTITVNIQSSGETGTWLAIGS